MKENVFANIQKQRLLQDESVWCVVSYMFGDVKRYTFKLQDDLTPDDTVIAKGLTNAEACNMLHDMKTRDNAANESPK